MKNGFGGVGLCVLPHADDADEAQMTADFTASGSISTSSRPLSYVIPTSILRHPDLYLTSSRPLSYVIPTEVEGSLDKLEMTWRHSETLRLRSG